MKFTEYCYRNHDELFLNLLGKEFVEQVRTTWSVPKLEAYIAKREESLERLRLEAGRACVTGKRELGLLKKLLGEMKEQEFPPVEKLLVPEEVTPEKPVEDDLLEINSRDDLIRLVRKYERWIETFGPEETGAVRKIGLSKKMKSALRDADFREWIQDLGTLMSYVGFDEATNDVLIFNSTARLMKRWKEL